LLFYYTSHSKSSKFCTGSLSVRVHPVQGLDSQAFSIKHQNLVMGRGDHKITGWMVLCLNPVRGKRFLSFPDQPSCPSSFLFSEYTVFPPGVKPPGREGGYRPPLASRLRMSGALPLLPSWAAQAQVTINVTNLFRKLLYKQHGHLSVTLPLAFYTVYKFSKIK